MTAPTQVIGQSLDSATDVDWYKITTGATDAGKFIRLLTTPGDGYTDTVVEVATGACGSLTSFATVDNDYHEMLLTPAVALATTYYIKVSWSSATTYTGANKYYNLAASLETEPATGNTCAAADSVTLPYAPTTPFLMPSDTDEDWFTFTTGASDANKVLEVKTLAGDYYLDTTIAFYDTDCTTLLGSSADTGYLDTYVSPALLASHTYKVRIGYSTGSPQYGDALYLLSMKLLGPPPEVEPNDTCAQAQAVTLPFTSAMPLSIATATDQDWFKVTVAAGDVGKSLHVVTSPGATNCDTYVEILHGTSCTTLNQYGVGDDYYLHEDVLSMALNEAGTYYVKVTWSPDGGWAGTKNTYNLAITLE